MDDSSNKRQRLLDDIMLSEPINPDGFTPECPKMIPVTFDEMTKVNHPKCYACTHITPASLRENKYHFNLLKLYTDNSTSICKDAIYALIKEYYDKEIKPNTDIEWHLAAIKEHFQSHTMYPTDEILRQINITQGVRSFLMDNLMERSENGDTVKFQMNNLKMLISLNKELRTLRLLKNDVPGMIGYDQQLNY